MKTWIYCLVDEQGSCTKLGLKRQFAIEYVKNKKMNMIGISSVNRFHKNTFVTMVEHAIAMNADTIVLNIADSLSKKDRKYIMDFIQERGIANAILL